MLNYRNDDDRSISVTAAIVFLVVIAVGATYFLLKSVRSIDFSYLNEQQETLESL